MRVKTGDYKREEAALGKGRGWEKLVLRSSEQEEEQEGIRRDRQ
jgi:hypothetical protein